MSETARTVDVLATLDRTIASKGKNRDFVYKDAPPPEAEETTASKDTRATFPAEVAGKGGEIPQRKAPTMTSDSKADAGERLQCEAIARAALGEPPKRAGEELLFHCSNHQDEHASLSVNPKKNVWMCGPCGASGNAWQLAAFLAKVNPDNKPAVKAYLQKIGVWKDSGKHQAKSAVKGRGPCVAAYLYGDAEGNAIARKLRFEPGADGRKKDFVWERLENGEWRSGLASIKTPLYRISKVINEPFVVLTEGEKDADAGGAIGLPTATSGGTGSWRGDHAECLRGKSVVIVADADDVGRTHALAVAVSLYGKAASLKVVELPGAKDLSEWVEQGGTADGLRSLVDAAQEWKPASGAELIRRFESIFRDKIIAIKGVSLVGALYALMTYCYKVFSWIAYLAFFSPLESCGKSHAADIVGWASAGNEILVSITEASLFRLITVAEPTIVIDEAEVLCGDEETAVALRAVLHAGNSPDDVIIRCAPKTHGVERFSPWCPKIFCNIGRLPRTLASRCIAVGMKRKKASERTGKFIRHKVKNELAKLAAEMGVWVAQHEKEIQRVYDSLPDDCFEDRDRENFAPLKAILAVADPARLSELAAARVSLMQASEATLTDESPSARVLGDAHQLLLGKQVAEMASLELCTALAQIESSPWADYKGKPLTPARLATLLKPFGIFPDRIGPKDSQARGYTLHQLEDAFSRYLQPLSGLQPVNPSTDQCLCGSGEDFRPSTKEAVDTLKNSVSANKDAGGRRVDTLKPVSEPQELFPLSDGGETLAESSPPAGPGKAKEEII
jgi:hypothetical protein